MDRLVHKYTDEGKVRELDICYINTGNGFWDVKLNFYHQGTLTFMDGRRRLTSNTFTQDEVDYMVELIKEAFPKLHETYMEWCFKRDEAIEKDRILRAATGETSKVNYANRK